ncbi:hypothetical protein [Microcoleus sp.]|uniref:hypothetical protein n=1 Tax=Microcoleus sp. TaxID=44472 RepID=UPI0035256924
MTNETNLTGINEMKNVEIGEEAQVAAIIGAIAPLIEQLNGEKVTITGIGKMEGGKIGGQAKVAAIINGKPNLSEEKIAEEAIKKIEANPILKQQFISAAKAGLLAALKELPGGKIVVAVIEGWLEPEPNLKLKQKQLGGSDII